MDGINFNCPDKKVLVLASANEEFNIVTRDYTWTSLAGKKLKVYSLRESFENAQRKGTYSDPFKFYVRWEKGGPEFGFLAKKVKFKGWAGSSFNIADHLISLGMKDVTMAAFMEDGPELIDLHMYCQEKGLKLIPLGASNTGRTFVFEDDSNSNSVVCMQKPAELDCGYNSQKLDQKWDIIISSSTPADKDVLRMEIHLFEKNPQAIKTVMPSLSLINSEDQEIRDLFEELIKLADVFQVNDTEASRYLKLGGDDGILLPIERRKLVLDLVHELRVPIVIVTMGREGAAVVATDSDALDKDRYFYQKALKEKNWSIKSTVGSGDAFHAGFMRIYMQAVNNSHGRCLRLAARIGSEIAIRNACVWGGNMSQDESKRLPEKGFQRIVDHYKDRE